MPHTHPNLDSLIIDSVEAMVIVTDELGRIIRFNAGGTKITGYAEHELLGRTIWDVLAAPEYRQRARERFSKLICGRGMHVEAEWLTKSGERKNLSCFCIGIGGPDGKIAYTIGTGMDSTERVRMERELREREERFRGIFAGAAIGMALVDERGRYLHVNRAFCELTGYDEEELKKIDLLAITHPDDRDRNREMFRSLLAGERAWYVIEKRYIRREGQEVWVQVSASVASTGQGRPGTIIGLFENISQRKAAQETLNKAYQDGVAMTQALERRVAARTAELQTRSEELHRSKHELIEQSRILRSILASMGDAVYVADANGTLQLTNPAAERISGPIRAGVDNVVGRPNQPWYYLADGETRCPPDQLPLMRSTGGEAVDDQELMFRRGESAEVWLSATSRPLKDEAGNPSGAVAVVRDITERKRNERELQQANASLERANASLRESERHYRELAASHLRLAREVEHRVRNNLQGLKGLLSATRGRASDVNSFADAMETRLAAMLQVHELLAQTRWMPVGLRTLVEGTFTALKYLACEPSETRIEGPDVLIGARQMLPLTMVIVEWFTNSCKYGAHSVAGGSLNIRWETIPDDFTLPRIRLQWIERGGPPIEGSIIPSLGTELVQAFAGNELAGRVELRYPPEGAEYVLEFAVREEEEPRQIRLIDDGAQDLRQETKSAK